MTKLKNVYWDTCVFIAHLAGDNAYLDYLSDIDQFLREASDSNVDVTIHCSTLTIAEITKSNLHAGLDYEDFTQLWGGGIVPLSPDPNVMRIASELRSMVYKKTGGQRKLSTPDAIHLASTIFLQDTYKLKIDAFHTFDSGKSRDHNGKGVPMLGFENWCSECADNPLAKKVIALNRCKPEHPNKMML